MATENREYQQRSRDRRRAAGGRSVSIILTPAEAAALAKLQSDGMTARDAIGQALIAQAKRIK